MNVVEAYRKIISNWRKILIIESICIIIGFIVSLSIPKEYTVSTVLIKEKKEIASSDRLSLGLFDVFDMSNMDLFSSKDAYSLFLYPELFDSPDFRKSLLNIQILQADGKKSTLQDYLNLDLSYPWWYNIINKIKSVGESRESNKSEGEVSIEEWESIEKLRDRISLIINRKSLTMTVNVTMQDPITAYIVADSVSLCIQKFISEYRIAKAKQEFLDAELLCLDAQKKYYSSQERYLNFLDSNNNLSSYKEKVNRDILKIEKDLALNTYNQAAKQLQLAKAKVEEERPAFFVLVPPIVPTKPSYPSKILVILGFLIWGCIFSVWYTFK